MKFTLLPAALLAVATAMPAPEGLAERGDCGKLPTGTGPIPTPDTPSAFLALSNFSTIARGAGTPPGFKQTYLDLRATTETSGYLGYTDLTTYNATTCATKCKGIKSCVGFNIYFERDPTQVSGRVVPLNPVPKQQNT
ncbi:uncharacterized protein B0I36DRAFT_349595 [Microdochium trichocladiopsis]|uniref:Apple domain-containing protein n=1 Tax=Microdochium trichocladiopsis TaxID=1682393 RepID=A0A9P8Y7U7_9PEZI|nr:uncharacterized protein B0I36DRAFT_349595 [Microdochium trichocladiopsis]KAH7031527.1 hypothetical protein B0I36DRAFT_349595 [Microdochium trichocladiopsis]